MRERVSDFVCMHEYACVPERVLDEVSMHSILGWIHVSVCMHKYLHAYTSSAYIQGISPALLTTVPYIAFQVRRLAFALLCLLPTPNGGNI